METYRRLTGQTEKKKLQDLEEEIKAISEQIEKTGASGEIRGFWHRVTLWFHKESGEAHETSEETESD